MELFMTLTAWHWFTLGLVLMILELFVGSFFLLWIGITALVVGLIRWFIPDLSGEAQAIIFAVGAVGAVLITRKYAKASVTQQKTGEPALNRRAEQYVGREFTLETPIVNGRGKICAGDTSWLIEGVDMPAGTIIQVVGASGVILKVKKV